MKLTIPSILVATVLVAGLVAYMPVEEASAVHTTIQSTQFVLKADVDSCTGAAGCTADAATITMNVAGVAEFVNLIVDYTAGTNTDEINILANTIDCDGLTNIEHAAIDPGADSFIVEFTSILEAGADSVSLSNPLIGTRGTDCVLTFSNIAGNFDAAGDTLDVTALVWTESQDAFTVDLG